MPSDADQIRDLEAELDALDNPTTAEVLSHTQDYDAGIVAAIGVQRGTGAGGDVTWAAISSAIDGEDGDPENVVLGDGTIGAVPNGGSQPEEWISRTLTTAELLDLHNTAVEVLPAPGGRLYYVVNLLVLHYRFNTTPFTGSLAALQLSYDQVGVGDYLTPCSWDSTLANMLQQSEDTYSLPLYASGYAAASSVRTWSADSIEDKPIVVGLGSGQLQDGDGSLTVRVLYSLIDGAA